MKTLKKILRFVLVEWNEFITIPLGITLFFVFPRVLRLFDSTTAAYDAGVLHSYISAVAGMLIIHGYAWIMLRITFPGIYKFFDDAFEKNINASRTFDAVLSERDKHLTLSVWQKSLLALAVFSLYLLGTVLLAKIF
jgi:hypothetical protein